MWNKHNKEEHTNSDTHAHKKQTKTKERKTVNRLDSMSQ